MVSSALRTYLPLLFCLEKDLGCVKCSSFIVPLVTPKKQEGVAVSSLV